VSIARLPAGDAAPQAPRRWTDFRRGATSRLFRRYFAVMALGTCGILLPALVVETSLRYAEGLRTIEEVQGARVEAAAAGVAAELGAIELQVREVADLPWGREALTEADRRAEFHRLLKRVPAILDLTRYDASARETLHVSRIEADRPAGGGDALPAAERAGPQDVAFGPVELRDSLEPFVHFTVHEGSFGEGGWVRARIDLKHVADYVARLPVPGGLAYLVDNRGVVIAHPNVEFMLRRSRAADPQVLAYALDAATGKPTRAALEAVSLDGKAVYAGVASIGTPPWTIAIEQPADLVAAPLRRALWGALAILAIALFMSFLVSLWYARRLSGPILALEEGAVAFAQGNFRKRLQVRTGDEIELLAGEFNRMADQLQEYTHGLERRVAEKTAQLEMANRHKSAFLANMSHELRTPLNAIIGFSEALRERMFGSLNAKQMEYVGDIYSSGQHLLSLINDILDLSKVEAGHMSLDVTTFDVRAAVDNCCTLIRERALRHRLRFTCEVDPEVSRWPADERKFKQVLINLLSNAVKFTPPGGEVSLRARVREGRLVVSVSDTGIGIAPEHRAAIFDEFHQVESPNSPRHEGTGLGLALSRRLVELHHGTLTVESEPSKGSTFTASFPGAKKRGDPHG